MSAAPRHFLDLKDFPGAELRRILALGAALKARRRKGEPPRERPLAGSYRAAFSHSASVGSRLPTHRA